MRCQHSMTRMVGFLCLLQVACAGSAPAVSADEFYKASDMPGYWWKKDPPEEEKAEDPKKAPKAAPQAQEKAPKEPRFPQMSDYTNQELYDMYPDQFVELEDDFKKEAVQTPTPENVAAYLKMQDIARRKAQAFANVAQYTLLQHPELNLEKDYQVSGPGKEVTKQVANSEIADMIGTAKDDFGLVFFYRPNCPYCDAEEKVLQFIINRGWLVKFINVEEETSAAAVFNITVTPSLLLVKKGEKDYLPMAYGVITYTELAEQIYNGVLLMNGQSSPEQFGMRESQRGGGFDPQAPLR